MTISSDILTLKLSESLASPAATLTARDVRLPRLPNKALAVIGVRRGGKSSVLARLRSDQIAAGRHPASELLLSFEDERLLGADAGDLAWLFDEHARQFPDLRATQRTTLYLDEIQVVAGWEGFVRRMIDSGVVDIVVSGSSARLLSQEIATSLRGRALAATLFPFSFREALRHAGNEPTTPYVQLPPTERARLDAQCRRYVVDGGFPEAQGLELIDRTTLLRSYVDVMVLRDVIERHAVSNVTALRWLERQLLANPGGAYSVQKAWTSARSQGLMVGKDTMHDYLAHLEDAFLIRSISMHSASERQRMVNPRKGYPIDPALIPIFSRTGREQLGRALETVVFLELARRECDVSYLRTRDDWEVDFLAERPGHPPLLVQVCLNPDDPETWTRETRALEVARAQIPDAECWIVTRDGTPPQGLLPDGVRWAPAAAWLLDAW